MELIRHFDKLTKSNVVIAGGKGASLGEMTQAGIPVPEGFVILSKAFERFIEETDLDVEIDSILHKVKHEDINTVENASEKIQFLIFSREMPKDIASEIGEYFKKLGVRYVAVRSSATSEDSASAAWAGQLDSYLNTTEKTLLENVKKCWASLFTPRAIFYRIEKGLHKEKVSVAVVIQKMVESEISGIAFSVHPVTQDYNQLIIEVGFGLGEAIVSGQVTPDSYVVEKEPRRIINKNISNQEKGLYRLEKGGNEWKNVQGDKQKLSDKEILELSELILRIEKHYGFPCDIEWAREKGKFYIVQSRPITTLTKSLIGDKNHKNSLYYVRMFEGTGMPLLINTIAFKYYEPLEVIAIFRDNLWTTYLPKKSEMETLKEGIMLFGDQERFNTYKKEFNDYKNKSKHFLGLVIIKNKISISDLKESFELIAQHWKYYQKTEFFYVDKAFKQSQNNETIKRNLKELEEIKNSGRVHLNSLVFGNNSYLTKIISILANQFNKRIEDLFFYTAWELLNLYGGKEVSEEFLNERRKSYSLISKNGKEKILQGDESQSFIDNFLDIDLNVTQIRGISANKGKVKGIAKVIRYGYEDFDKMHEKIDSMNKGDILVAETTAPELIVACKKASAIVTNQGGLLSHAAIVSRELGIPCLVGTEIAVEVIKDGDLVEVDADNGIVKILSRKNKKEKLSREDIKIEEWEFEFQQRNTQPILMADFWCRALYRKFVNEINLPVEPYDYFFTTSSKGYVKTAQKKITLEAMKKAFDNDNAHSVYLYNQTIKRVNELEAIAKHILGKINEKISNKELVELWKKFDEALLTLIPWYWIPYYPVEQNLLSDKVKIGLIKYKDKIEKITDFNNAFLISMSPTKEMAFKEEQKDFFDIIKIAIKNDNFFKSGAFNEKAKTYLKKYSWMNTFVLLPIEPLSLNELIEKVKKAIDEKSIETYYLQEKKKAENDEISKKILQIVKEDKELLSAIEDIKKIGWVLTWSVENSLHTLADLQPFFKLIAKHLEVSYLHWIHLTSNEIVQILEGKDNVEEMKLKEREKGYFFVMEKGIQKMAIGEKGKSLSEWVEKNLNKVDENITELKGQSACSGHAKGSVRIALIAKDSYNLKEGEILVCAMTSPDYVPAMKRASAIITDEGGLLSHAAIMSREFGKPCVIATKIATRVLKEGDFIEVDADKGIIKILKSS